MAIFTVTTANDVVNAGDGLTSLREAVTLAGAAFGSDTIVFDAGLSGSTLVLTGGQLSMFQPLTIDGDIDGDDKADITISGNNASRIFDIVGSLYVFSSVDLRSLTLIDGNAGASGGGAIRTCHYSFLSVSDSTFSNNTAAYGGAISIGDFSFLEITNSLFTGNTAIDRGGAIDLNKSSSLVTLTNSSVDGNISSGSGGGISENSYTGGVGFAPKLRLYNSNITNNYSTNGGGFDGTYIGAYNSVIAGNTNSSGANDVSGSVYNATNSFFGTAVIITQNDSGNINGGGDPHLEALADNGGTVQTQLALSSSRLIDTGDNGSIPAGLVQDANGNARIVSTSVDIGATESALPPGTVIVDNAVDELDGDYSAGDLSLREAISLAGTKAIVFDASLSGKTIVLAGTELALSQSITIDGDIDGDNKADITIDGNNASRIFNITGATTDVDLLSLTLINGMASSGGAVLSAGINSLDIVNTNVLDSTGTSTGGGLRVLATAMTTITNSLFSGNHSAINGGAIFGSGGGAITITNTTVYGNTADGFGGGIFADNTIDIFNSTIVGNGADYNGASTTNGGGLLSTASATISVTNSVIAQNTSGTSFVADDVRGTVDTANNSFFGTVEIIAAGAGNNNGGGDSMLGELLNNSGTTLTLSPLDGSPLIGAGSNAAVPADALDIDNDKNTAEDLPLDGRGGVRVVGGTVDIGAVEQIVDEVIGGTDGDDIINGGAGIDTASYENASGAVTVDLHTGTTSGADGSDTLIGIENVIGSEFDDTLRGSAFAGDTITGLGGNDTIVGRAGLDTMIGGDGDDSYFVQQPGDVVIENLNEGDDTVRVYFDNYTLTANVEEGRVVGAANILFGNELDNLLAGGGGGDELHGGDGNDTLTGNGGGDILFGDAGDDRLIGSSGADTLNGGDGDDRLEGNGDIDILNGGDGDDVLFGGGGRDFMTGGRGADRFVFADGDFGGNSFALADRILDFDKVFNEFDSIDLRPTDADITTIGDQSFTFIAGAAFSGTAGELRVIQSGGRTYVQGDTDGDGTSEFMIRLEGLHYLGVWDFFL